SNIKLARLGSPTLNSRSGDLTISKQFPNNTSYDSHFLLGNPALFETTDQTTPLTSPVQRMSLTNNYLCSPNQLIKNNCLSPSFRNTSYLMRTSLHTFQTPNSYRKCGREPIDYGEATCGDHEAGIDTDGDSEVLANEIDRLCNLTFSSPNPASLAGSKTARSDENSQSISPHSLTPNSSQRQGLVLANDHCFVPVEVNDNVYRSPTLSTRLHSVQGSPFINSRLVCVTPIANPSAEVMRQNRNYFDLSPQQSPIRSYSESSSNHESPIKLPSRKFVERNLYAQIQPKQPPCHGHHSPIRTPLQLRKSSSSEQRKQ
ncbi:hypothetical protein Ciccas_012633, partial [Cichlidogyrus casuarinus]